VSGRLPCGAGLRRRQHRVRAHLLPDRPLLRYSGYRRLARVTRQIFVRLSKAALLPVVFLSSVDVWLGSAFDGRGLAAMGDVETPSPTVNTDWKFSCHCWRRG
jgi:hypothetical protein